MDFDRKYRDVIKNIAASKFKNGIFINKRLITDQDKEEKE